MKFLKRPKCHLSTLEPSGTFSYSFKYYYGRTYPAIRESGNGIIRVLLPWGREFRLLSVELREELRPGREEPGIDGWARVLVRPPAPDRFSDPWQRSDMFTKENWLPSIANVRVWRSDAY